MPNAITQCFLPGFEPRPLDPEIDEHTHNEATALPREIRGLFDIANGKQLNTGLVRQVRLIRVYISFFFINRLAYFVLYRKCSISAWASIVADSSSWFRYSLVSMSVDIARDLAGVHPLAAVSSNSEHPGTRWKYRQNEYQFTCRSENLDENTLLRVNWG